MKQPTTLSHHEKPVSPLTLLAYVPVPSGSPV